MLKLLLWCTLRSFAYTFCIFGDAGVDPVVIESRADEMVGSVSRDEYKALVGHLSGARRNRVFHALGLSAPQREAESKLAEGQGGPKKAKALEKAKRKQASSSAEPKKKSRLINSILHQSPLQSKGESEDGGSEDSNRPPTEATPFGIPQVAVPLRAVHPGLDLEFSTAQESEGEGNVEEVNVVVDSPRRSSLPRGAPTSGKEAEVPSEKTAEASSSPEKSTSSSGAKRVAAETPAVCRMAVASSFVTLILKLWLWNSMRSPMLCASAGTSSNLFVLRAGTANVGF